MRLARDHLLRHFSSVSGTRSNFSIINRNRSSSLSPFPQKDSPKGDVTPVSHDTAISLTLNELVTPGRNDKRNATIASKYAPYRLFESVFFDLMHSPGSIYPTSYFREQFCPPASPRSRSAVSASCWQKSEHLRGADFNQSSLPPPRLPSRLSLSQSLARSLRLPP